MEKHRSGGSWKSFDFIGKFSTIKMRRHSFLIRLYFSGFGTTENFGKCHQKADIIILIAFWRIHKE